MKEKEFYKDQYKMLVQQNAEMEERLNKQETELKIERDKISQ